MSGITRTTTDHSVIQKWAEARGGEPSHVKSTASPDDAGILRIAFPDHENRKRLEDVDWSEFFAAFEDKELALLYQEATSDGEISRFCRFISRNS